MSLPERVRALTRKLVWRFDSVRGDGTWVDPPDLLPEDRPLYDLVPWASEGRGDQVRHRGPWDR